MKAAVLLVQRQVVKPAYSYCDLNIDGGTGSGIACFMHSITAIPTEFLSTNFPTNLAPPTNSKASGREKLKEKTTFRKLKSIHPFGSQKRGKKEEATKQTNGLN